MMHRGFTGEEWDLLVYGVPQEAIMILRQIRTKKPWVSIHISVFEKAKRVEALQRGVDYKVQYSFDNCNDNVIDVDDTYDYKKKLKPTTFSFD